MVTNRNASYRSLCFTKKPFQDAAGWDLPTYTNGLAFQMFTFPVQFNHCLLFSPGEGGGSHGKRWTSINTGDRMAVNEGMRESGLGGTREAGSAMVLWLKRQVLHCESEGSGMSG